MVLECCAQERTYLRFYGLLAERFCLIDRVYQVRLYYCTILAATLHRNKETKP